MMKCILIMMIGLSSYNIAAMNALAAKQNQGDKEQLKNVPETQEIAAIKNAVAQRYTEFKIDSIKAGIAELNDLYRLNKRTEMLARLILNEVTLLARKMNEVGSAAKILLYSYIAANLPVNGTDIDIQKIQEQIQQRTSDIKITLPNSTISALKVFADQLLDDKQMVALQFEAWMRSQDSKKTSQQRWRDLADKTIKVADSIIQPNLFTFFKEQLLLVQEYCRQALDKAASMQVNKLDKLNENKIWQLKFKGSIED